MNSETAIDKTVRNVRRLLRNKFLKTRDAYFINHTARITQENSRLHCAGCAKRDALILIHKVLTGAKRRILLWTDGKSETCVRFRCPNLFLPVFFPSFPLSHACAASTASPRLPGSTPTSKPLSRR